MKTYKTGEVAKILNVAALTVRNEIEKGSLKAFKVGTEYRITEEVLNQYMGIVEKDKEKAWEVEKNELLSKIESLEQKLKDIRIIVFNI